MEIGLHPDKILAGKIPNYYVQAIPGPVPADVRGFGSSTSIYF
jgi:hypothetical protein